MGQRNSTECPKCVKCSPCPTNIISDQTITDKKTSNQTTISVDKNLSNDIPSYLGCYGINHDIMRPAVVTKYTRFNLDVKNKNMTIFECNDAAKKHDIATFGIQKFINNEETRCVMDQDYTIKQQESENTCILNLSDDNYYGVLNSIAKYNTI